MTEYRTQNTGYRTQDTGYRIPMTEYRTNWIQETRSRVQNIEFSSIRSQSPFFIYLKNFIILIKPKKYFFFVLI